MAHPLLIALAIIDKNFIQPVLECISIKEANKMKRLVIIGKWLKGKKMTIIDLHAFRELKQRQKDMERNNKSLRKKPDHRVPLDI